MRCLHISLFGKLIVRFDGRILGGFDASKMQELFCYLLLHRDRPHPRETLAGLFWGDNPTAQSKKYLRQVLWQLQSALDSQIDQSAGKLLRVENEWVHLDSGAGLWLDVAEFERAFLMVQGLPGQQIGVEQARALEFAARLYEADLLEGWYQDWCLYERERFQNIYLSMLDKLTSHCEAHNQCEMGLVWGTQILKYDRARERTHRQMMRLQYILGDRTGALRQYERCAAALGEELGVRPDKSTTGLYEQIKAGQLVIDESRGNKRRTGHETAPASLPEVLTRLKRLRTTLGELQKEIQQDIRAVELSLTEEP